MRTLGERISDNNEVMVAAAVVANAAADLFLKYSGQENIPVAEARVYLERNIQRWFRLSAEVRAKNEEESRGL